LCNRFSDAIDQYVSGQDTSLLSHIENFVRREEKLQHTSISVGTVSSGGLGDPKFNIDIKQLYWPMGEV